MIFLASQSKTRLQLLRNAGLAVEPIATGFDEAKAQAEFKGLNGHELSLALAKGKACFARPIEDRAFVIGADQTLECDGQIFHKPRDKTEARQSLSQLRGRAHLLHSSACCVCKGEIIWSATDSASLWVRDFSSAFLDDYMAKAGEPVLQSVGSYQYEHLGAQLFERVEGDYFTILGIPLLPLLAFLRSHGEIIT